jgi:hypothetical protein
MKGKKLVIIIIQFHKFTNKYPENWTIFKEFLMIFMVLTLTFITLLTCILYKFALIIVKIFITFQRIFNDLWRLMFSKFLYCQNRPSIISFGPPFQIFCPVLAPTKVGSAGHG